MANTTVFKANGIVATGTSLASANAKAKAQETPNQEDKPKAVYSEDRFTYVFHGKSKRIDAVIDVSREDVFSKSGDSNVWNSRRTIDDENGRYVVQINVYKKISGRKNEKNGVEMIDD
jgi:hypothetical protein